MLKIISSLVLLYIFQCVNSNTFKECKVLSTKFEQIGEARGTPKPDRYNTSEIKLHITDLQLKKFTHDAEKSFACVDGRKTTPTFGVPGGDFGEFILGLQSYTSLTNRKNFTRLEIRKILKGYIDYTTTKTRPFYYHTAKTKLIRIFNSVNPKAVILPEKTPDNLEDWLTHFVNPNHQGCGHIRMLLQYPEAMGITNPKLVPLALQAMLEVFWIPGYTEKLQLDVLQGELHPNAVVLVNTEGCANRDPEIVPNRIGSSIFVHHPNAVKVFRNLKSSKYFASLNPKVDQEKLMETIMELAKLQLEAVLTKLEPAAEVGQFLVTLHAEETYIIPWNTIYEVFIGFISSSFIFGVLIAICVFVGISCCFLSSLKKYLFKKGNNHYNGLYDD
eukprot:gene10713-3335_t